MIANLKPWLRIIGDVHAGPDNDQYTKYFKIAKEAEYSIQVGDLSFNYYNMKELDHNKHKVIAGNHDNYERVSQEYADLYNKPFIYQTDHFLGDYGIYELPEFEPIFFVRGGYSLDCRQRAYNLEWWADEQLNYATSNLALESYEKHKPELVITHECPSRVIEYVSEKTHWDGYPIRPSSTAQLLDTMFSIHKPKRWIFGHHHKDATFNHDDTEFTCLGILSHIDLQKNEKRKYR